MYIKLKKKVCLIVCSNILGGNDFFDKVLKEMMKIY